MAKENFPITLDVDEAHLGQVLRLLNNTSGIVNIHLQIARTPAAPKTIDSPQSVDSLQHGLAVAAGRAFQTGRVNKVPRGNPILRQVVANALSNGPMHFRMISEFLRRSGFSKNSVGATLTKMAADKTITRVAPGTYRLTVNGQRKYVEVTHPHKVHKRDYHTRPADNKSGIRALILKALLGRDFSHAEVIKVITENNYSANNIYNIVPKLQKEGLISRNGNTYSITESGKQVFEPEIIGPEEVSYDAS